MKKMILIIALIISGLTVKAQEQGEQQQEQQQQQQSQKAVHPDVASSFSEKFPDVSQKDVDWKTEQGYHRAEFSQADKDYEVVFDNTGEWITTEVNKVSINEVPEEVKNGLDETAYREWNVNEIEMTESKDLVLYKIELRKGIKGTDLYFDAEGNILRIDS